MRTLKNTSFGLLLPLIFLLTACGRAEERSAPVTDPAAPATIAILFGGLLHADGQSVIREPSQEDLQSLGGQTGDQLETVHFSTLPIEGGPTLVFHATYVYSNGIRQECRACTMTLSAAAFTKNPDGTWQQQAFERHFADVSAAYEVLPVEAVPIGQGRWLLQHETCWCGAGGDCMCSKNWHALEADPGWFKPLLSQEFHRSHEDSKVSYAEDLSAHALAGTGSYPDLEITHSFSEAPMRRNAKTKTREEKTRFTYDTAKRSYATAEP